MSKPLRFYPQDARVISVAERRLKHQTRGLGFWAAADFWAIQFGKAAARAKITSIETA